MEKERGREEERERERERERRHSKWMSWGTNELDNLSHLLRLPARTDVFVLVHVQPGLTKGFFDTLGFVLLIKRERERERERETEREESTCRPFNSFPTDQDVNGQRGGEKKINNGQHTAQVAEVLAIIFDHRQDICVTETRVAFIYPCICIACPSVQPHAGTFRSFLLSITQSRDSSSSSSFSSSFSSLIELQHRHTYTPVGLMWLKCWVWAELTTFWVNEWLALSLMSGWLSPLYQIPSSDRKSLCLK